LAFEEYKEKNPHLNLELIVEDDGYDSKKGINAFNKLKSIDDVDAIINLSSVTIDAIHDQVNEWNKPFIQLGEETDHRDDNVFEVYPSQKAALVAVGQQAKKDGHVRVSVITEQIAAYQRFIDGFEEGFGSKVSVSKINPTEIDMRTFALKVAQEKPDAVALFMGSTAAANFVKSYSQQMGSIPPIYFDTGLELGIDDLKKSLGNLSLLEGAKGASIITDIHPRFKSAYKERFGIDSGALAEFGYDSFMLLMSKYESSSSKWVSGLKESSYEGVSGTIQLDKFGDRVPKFKIITLVGGKLK